MISQREAQRMRKRIQEFEHKEMLRADAWTTDWPNGVHVGSVQVNADGALVGSIRTSRKLKHAVVATCTEAGVINFHALPL